MAAEERYFERRQVREAISWAEDGGIAIHRNFDHYHGTRSARGFVMTRPFLHVIGLRVELNDWARQHGVPAQAIQPEKRRRVAHIDVFGDYGLQLLARFDPLAAAATSFEIFSRMRSKLYAQFSAAILDAPELLSLAATAPVGQAPPLLLFAAVHYLLLSGISHPLARYYPSLNGGSTAAGDAFGAFRDFCRTYADLIGPLLRERTVQTNEVARSSALQPGFSVVAREARRPLALLEIGTSAGLNLIGDRYLVVYGKHELGDPRARVRIECRLHGGLVPPLQIAEVAWRLGIDRSPIDVTDPEQARWLQALVWPDQPWRAAVLRAAIGVAQEDPPPLLRGNALDVLPEAIAAAPEGAALCLFSSFTRYQLSLAQQARLDALIVAAARSRPIHRLELESHGGERPVLELETLDGGRRRRRQLANAQDHGGWLEWLDADSATV